MTRFHVNSNGQAAKCTATLKACPLGGEHYDSMREAAEAAMDVAQRDLHANEDASHDERACSNCGATVSNGAIDWCSSCVQKELREWQASGEANLCDKCGNDVGNPWDGWCPPCSAEVVSSWRASHVA